MPCIRPIRKKKLIALLLGNIIVWLLVLNIYNRSAQELDSRDILETELDQENVYGGYHYNFNDWLRTAKAVAQYTYSIPRRLIRSIFESYRDPFHLPPYNASALNDTWDRAREPIVFLHIGKNGGTSFDAKMKPLIKRMGGKYVGGRHFDWSYIERQTGPKRIVLLLRDPVTRAISHFKFMQKLAWTKNSPVRRENISQYLKDYQTMLETRDAWQDGQAAVSWLSGTHIAGWVVSKIDPDEVRRREELAMNVTYVLLKAAENLRSSFWFGFLEDQERSFELLQDKLAIQQPIKLPSANKNKRPATPPTEADIETLKRLVPQDMWLYEYAQRLFDARWHHYKTGFYEDPALPPFPNITCQSTRFVLRCKDPHIYHLWKFSESEIPRQMKLLPDFNASVPV